MREVLPAESVEAIAVVLKAFTTVFPNKPNRLRGVLPVREQLEKECINQKEELAEIKSFNEFGQKGFCRIMFFLFQAQCDYPFRSGRCLPENTPLYLSAKSVKKIVRNRDLLQGIFNSRNRKIIVSRRINFTIAVFL